MTQRVDELNEAERAWIASLLAELHADRVEIERDSLSEYFDRLRHGWFSTRRRKRPDPNPIVNRTGAGLGDLLVRSLGLRWAIVTDEYGTEMAVHGDVGDILLFPMNAVGKRWVDDDRGSLATFIDEASRSVLEVRAAHSV
jgi:hypothetical protein